MLISDIVAEHLPWWVKSSGVLTAACAGGAISEMEYLRKLEIAGLLECRVVERQFYEPSQLAAVVLENLPKSLSRLTCCGKNITQRVLTKLAGTVSSRIYSAKFSATAPIIHSN